MIDNNLAYGVIIIKVGRNVLCPCGSGKKYKKCCLRKDILYLDEVIRNKLKTPEPNINIVPSIIHNGFKFRAIWNKLYHSPVKNTFHEFLIDVLLLTFGKDWHSKQLQLDNNKRHVVMRWIYSNCEFSKTVIENGKKEIKDGEVCWGAFPTGEVEALHLLAYDLYCLQIVNKLPVFLIKRLINDREFQGARYEIAVAAIMARAGFDISFLDDENKSKKHCEFIATHKSTKVNIGVEAKSRRRKGVLNEEGSIDINSIYKGDVSYLFAKARQQKPELIPFLIFIDINIPPTPIPYDQKPWVKDISDIINEYGDATPINPDPYNAVVFTNFSYYYAGNYGDSPSGEYLAVFSNYPENRMDNNEVW